MISNTHGCTVGTPHIWVVARVGPPMDGSPRGSVDVSPRTNLCGSGPEKKGHSR